MPEKVDEPTRDDDDGDDDDDEDLDDVDEGFQEEFLSLEEPTVPSFIPSEEDVQLQGNYLN